MRAGAPSAGVESLGIPDHQRLLAEHGVGACCAALYEHPAVHWLLGGELHPGGEATTRRAIELIGLDRGDRLLDLACGTGASALLAARELECEVVGIDLSERMVSGARAAARAEGLDGRVGFACADATELPLPDASFEGVLCECALSTFADKAGAAAEIRRVLRRGGRAAISDVVVDPERLPVGLRGPMAAMACIGEAFDAAGYTQLLVGAGLRVTTVEPHDQAALGLAQRVEERLRGARVLGIEGIDELIEMAQVAQLAIADGALGYSIFAVAG